MSVETDRKTRLGWVRLRRELTDDRGSSVAEFAMTVVLLILLLFAVVQVAALFYVRSVAGAAASDGARLAANADADPDQGSARASALIRKGLGTGIAATVPCAGSLVDGGGGVVAAQVRCQGRIHSVFLPIGAFVSVDVAGRSLKESS